MERKETFNNLLFGGLFDHNKESEELRRLQINQGVRIHTCNNYGKSIEIIKYASKGIEKKLKILTKVYYRYPSIKHPRFRPLIGQLKEIVDRLGFIPSDWSLQLCCYCDLRELRKTNAQKFFKKIREKYNINQIYLEYYPIYNYQFKQIIELNSFYKKKISFGLIGYQNFLNRVFTNKDLKFLSSKSINVIFLCFLGRGIQNKSFSEGLNTYYKNRKIDAINANIIYLLSNQNTYKNIEGLTQVSSLEHYEDLKKRIIDMDQIVKDNYSIRNLINQCKIEIYKFPNYDQYGGYISFQKFFKKPKFFISKIKYHIISFFISLKFNNNFWG